MVNTNEIAVAVHASLELAAERLLLVVSGDIARGRLVRAETDSELAAAYLKSRNFESPHSLRSASRDAARFMVWLRYRQLSLNGLTVEDVSDYLSWLADPQPRTAWVSEGSKKLPREHKDYRLFSGPLKKISIAQCFRVAKAICSFAVKTGYTDRDPASLVPLPRSHETETIERYLDEAALRWVRRAIDTAKTPTANARRQLARTRFLFELLVTTGARLNEVATAEMSAIRLEGRRHWIHLVGKGMKPRRVPVTLDVARIFEAYRAAFDLPADLADSDDTMPLILSTKQHGQRKYKGVGDEAIYKAIKALFAEAAVWASSVGDAVSAVALRAASTHFLRHSALTIAANNDVSLKAVQQNAGHSSLAITSRYLHVDMNARHEMTVKAMSPTKIPDKSDTERELEERIKRGEITLREAMRLISEKG